MSILSQNTEKPTMNEIPIVFATDDNMVMPCGVTITSLLMNATSDTFYCIYILHDADRLNSGNIDKLKRISNLFLNASITFLDVKDAFDSIAINGEHLTKETYYRILIPDLFPQYQKIIYADVDIIFQQDLSDIYLSALKSDELVSGVLDLNIIDSVYAPTSLPEMVGSSVYEYINAGFLIMNLTGMRNADVEQKLKTYLGQSFDQNDQDILNIVCKNRIEQLPQTYNFQLNHFIHYSWGRKTNEFEHSFQNLFANGTLHYTGKDKPWNSLNCLCADTWWHYYKHSPFYDDVVYFSYQQQMHEALRRDLKKAGVKDIIFQLLSRIKHSGLKHGR